jgi:hypothetical protein
VKHFCEEHPDVCKRGMRSVRYSTPTPIPQGTLVIVP